MPRTHIDSSRIKQIYDARSVLYDRQELLFELLILRRLRRDLFAKASGKILEIGVGTGRNFSCYSTSSEITGIDLSPEMLKIAEQRANKSKRAVTLMSMGAHELAFPDRSFDTVASSLTLCTLIDPIQTLSEMARVVKPNGTILLLEHGRSPSPWLSRWLDRLEPHFVRHHGCHPNRNIVALAQAAGLQLLSIRRHLLGLICAIQCKPLREVKTLKRS